MDWFGRWLGGWDILLAKPRFAVNGLEALFEGRKSTMDFAAGKICAPRIALRLRARADGVANYEKSRDDQGFHGWTSVAAI
jgi:hypothetical protein